MNHLVRLKNQNLIQELREQTRKEIIAEKAQLLVDQGKISKTGPNHWKVISSDGSRAYDCEWDIAYDVLKCSCLHYFHRSEYCKHLLAVAMWIGTPEGQL